VTTTLSTPTDPHDAARWLLARHPWPAALVARVVGDTPGWVDDLSCAWQDLGRWRQAWDAYAATHPAPPWGADEGAWDAWEAAGPQPTLDAQAIAVMSTGEQAVIRLLATLTTSLTNLPTADTRSVALTVDWARLVLARCAWDPHGRAAHHAISQETP